MVKKISKIKLEIKLVSYMNAILKICIEYNISGGQAGSYLL